MPREIVQELIDAAIGERMNEQMTKDTRADGDSIGASQGAFGKLHRGRRSDGDDVTLRTRRIERRAELADDFDPAVAHLIEMIDGSHDARCACLRGQQRLRRVEDQKTRDPYTFAGEAADRAECVFHEWNLDDDLIRKPRELLAVSISIVAVDRVNGGEHRHGDRAADLGQQLALVSVVLAKQRRRRHHAVEEASRGAPEDVLEIGAREQNLHAPSRSRYSALGYATRSRKSACAGTGGDTPRLSVAERSSAKSSI